MQTKQRADVDHGTPQGVEEQQATQNHFLSPRPQHHSPVT